MNMPNSGESRIIRHITMISMKDFSFLKFSTQHISGICKTKTLRILDEIAEKDHL